jgi:hypothetical protein
MQRIADSPLYQYVSNEHTVLSAPFILGQRKLCQKIRLLFTEEITASYCKLKHK